jgi:hypothetical protein
MRRTETPFSGALVWQGCTGRDVAGEFSGPGWDLPLLLFLALSGPNIQFVARVHNQNFFSC